MSSLLIERSLLRRMRGFFVCACVCVGWIFLQAENAAAHASWESTHEHPDIVSCLLLGDSAGRRACYEDLCGADWQCAVSLTESAAKLRGAASGMQVIRDLVEDPSRELGGTAHELAHIVGRMSAREHGADVQAFLACPTDFVYGCQHGFFEEILRTSSAPAQAAQRICGPAGTALDAQSFFCHHGAGHGITMARAYDLQHSLEDCVQLPAESAQQGCAQGVFMEAINGYAKGEVRKGVFDRWRPLRPCSAVAPQWQWACYVNHAPYLMVRSGYRFQVALSACFDASPEMIPTCVQGFGQMATDQHWQRIIIEHSPAFAREPDFVQRAWNLCEEAGEYTEACLQGAVEQLVKYEKIDEAVTLCTLSPQEMQPDCAALIGSTLRFYGREEEIERICEGVPTLSREHCRTTQPSAPWQERGVEGRSTPRLEQLAHMVTTLLWSSVRMAFSHFVWDVPPQPEGAPILIRCTEKGFDPSQVSVPRGGKVTWLNEREDACWPASADHPTHELYPSFDAGHPLQEGERWGFRFTKKGEWLFHDHLFPSWGGKILVE